MSVVCTVVTQVRMHWMGMKCDMHMSYISHITVYIYIRECRKCMSTNKCPLSVDSRGKNPLYTMDYYKLCGPTIL